MTTQSSIPAQPPAAAAAPPASAASSQTTPAPASSASNASAASALPSPPIHRGAIDRTTITTAPPARVMHAMRSLLLRMGVRVRAESAFRMRCVRPGAGAGAGAGAEEEKEKDVENGDGPEEEREDDDDLEDEGDWGGDDDDWDGSDDQKVEEEDLEQSDSDSGSGSGSGSGSDTETEATSGTQRLRAGASKSKSKRVPKAKKRIQVHRISQSHILDPPTSNADSAPELRANSEANLNPTLAPSSSQFKPSKPKGPYKGRKCTLYGPSPSADPSHEVRFSVELTQLAGLPGTYSLDIRRLKGHLRSYKFIYDTLRELSVAFFFWHTLPRRGAQSPKFRRISVSSSSLTSVSSGASSNLNDSNLTTGLLHRVR